MKTSVYIATSLDGFIARDDGELDWLQGSDGGTEDEGGEDYGYTEFIESVDMIVMGRNTFEMVYAFEEWPYGETPMIVLSKTLLKLPPATPRTVKLQNCTPEKLWEELRSTGVQHVYVDGGKTIQGFLRAGVVNEITITTMPVLIGQGRPLFGPLVDDCQLELLETKTFPDGIVQSKYSFSDSLA